MNSAALPAFDALVATAIESIKPYRWLTRQNVCRACGNVHESKPVLMREVNTGHWYFEADDNGQHDDAPMVFEIIEMAWCEHCHSQAAQELTREVRHATEAYGNTNTLAAKLRIALARFDRTTQQEQFHNASSAERNPAEGDPRQHA